MEKLIQTIRLNFNYLMKHVLSVRVNFTLRDFSDRLLSAALILIIKYSSTE